MVMNFLVMPMFFLSGALFPLSGCPWMTVLTRIDPAAYGMDPLRGVVLRSNVPRDALAELTLYPVAVDVAVMAALAVVFLVPAVWLFAKRD